MSVLNWVDSGFGRLQVHETSLEFATWGHSPSNGPTIILLHEGLGCISLWRDFPKHLAAATGCGVFAYSRAGYGGSGPVRLPRSVGYMTEEALYSLPHVLDAVGVHNCILLGHSDGATISAIYVGSVADPRVRGLVLMAPHFFTEAEGLAEIVRARHLYQSGDLKERMAKYHNDPDSAFFGWNDVWTDPEFEGWNVADVIDHLRIPVLAIQGADDQYGTLAQIREIENRIYAPLEIQILKDCRHAPHIEQPGETLDSIVEFVRRLIRLENEQVAVV